MRMVSEAPKRYILKVSTRKSSWEVKGENTDLILNSIMTQIVTLSKVVIKTIQHKLDITSPSKNKCLSCCIL